MSDFHYRYTMAADNYEPTRTHDRGHVMHSATTDPEDECFILQPGTGSRYQPVRLYAGTFVLDFGHTVVPAYVAGWQPTTGQIILHRYPLSQGTRPDNGRPVDMSSWMLGPRRSFHLKLEAVE